MISKHQISIFDFRNTFVLLGFLLINVFGFSQNTPTLKFQKDSVLIGELTPVSFIYIHNSEEEVLFADSLFDFSPFEFEKIEVFNTVTKDTISKDSVVYWLSTFELDKIQTLKIPVFVYTKKDSIPVFSNSDSIRLTEVITVMSDTLKIKGNTTIQEVESEFNYPIFSIVLGVIMIIGVVSLLLFWKKIILYFKLKRLSKSHQIFLTKFEELTNQFNTTQSNDNLEELIVCWKKHLEKLRSEPITKLSTKELQAIITDTKIITILKNADGMIFGNILFKNVSNEIDHLKSFIEIEYSTKVELIKNEGN